MQAKIQSQNLLFGDEPPFPANLGLELPTNGEEERQKAQAVFVKHWETTGSSTLMLQARISAMQTIAELAKVIPQAAVLKAELPEVAVDSEYTVNDHLERLRYIDVSLPDGEYEALKNLLHTTLPFLADSHSDERHSTMKGKMAYNAIGICFGGGRNDKVNF